MKSLSQHRADVDSAAETLRAGRKALLRPDGQRIFSDAEHQRREDGLRQTFKETIADASAAAQTAALAASSELSRGDADPIHKLSTSELERANLLLGLQRERLLTAPIRDLDDEVQQVLSGADRASRFALWSICRERRQIRVDAAVEAAVDLTGRLRAQHGPEAGPLGRMAERLYETLVDTQARSAAREEAEAIRSEALALESRAVTSSYLESEYGPRPVGWRPGVEV